jgi:hypothetical protein
MTQFQERWLTREDLDRALGTALQTAAWWDREVSHAVGCPKRKIHSIIRAREGRVAPGLIRRPNCQRFETGV